jgi:hypothetical protein
MPIANMQGLAVHELCKLYDAEYRFLEGQEEMAQMASGPSAFTIFSRGKGPIVKAGVKEEAWPRSG